MKKFIAHRACAEMRMIMKKRLLTSILVGVLTLGTLAGCGSSNKPAADTGTSDEPAKTTTEAAGTESADAKDADSTEGGTITVAASATPHAEILEQAKPILAEQSRDGIYRLPYLMIM